VFTHNMIRVLLLPSTVLVTVTVDGDVEFLNCYCWRGCWPL